MELTGATDEAPVEGQSLPATETEMPAKEPASVTARRILLKAFTVGALSAIIGLGSGGNAVAIGAFAGCLAAAVYVIGYVRSHVFRKSAESTFEPHVTRLAAVRIGAIVAAGVALYVILGENATRAYLLALAASWLILVATEAPRAVKQLRARGIIG
ncbi:MAG TPA: hypothetical protein VHJ78_05980 [Actinomycetota bacterium]|nr:hypothetical protein [Actinomycetota bacterium]